MDTSYSTRRNIISMADRRASLMILIMALCTAALFTGMAYERAGAAAQAKLQEHLAEEVCADDDIRYCPHGRPVMIRYSRADLEKLFGRIQ